MLDLGAAALFAVFCWWFGTGVVFYVDRLPPRTHRLSLALGGGLAAICGWGLYQSAFDATNTGAYVGFTCALVMWGWHELSFLTGFVTGPRKTACSMEVTGFQRFLHATETVIHHELALAATLAGLAALTWTAPNPVGVQTFAVLWAMRVSAKLNVFFGVRNLSVELIPDHLRYLSTYFGRAELNAFLPLSIASASVVLLALAGRVLVHAEAAPVTAVGATLVSALLFLAIVEHVLLALPVQDSWLWRWALKGRPEA